MLSRVSDVVLHEPRLGQPPLECRLAEVLPERLEKRRLLGSQHLGEPSELGIAPLERARAPGREGGPQRGDDFRDRGFRGSAVHRYA